MNFSINNRKKIYFLLFAKNTNCKRFSLSGSNPGIGGTEFNIIITALKLSEAMPSWDFYLVNELPVDIEESPSNFNQTQSKDPIAFFESRNINPPTVVVAPVILLRKIPGNLLREINDKLVIWSHHPFDRDLRAITPLIKCCTVVCVGVYQHFSNKVSDLSLNHIQNIFTFPRDGGIVSSHQFNINQINIVHLGALIPAKGFIELAKAWRALKIRFPGVRLHVIGSSATYGEEPESKLIPTSLKYATQILDYIPEKDIQSGKVIFYGNMDHEKFEIIKKCDLAILNPTGHSEAFPASPLEILAFGVPVIASSDYGMSDCMRYFPELIIDGHEDIVGKVEYLVSDNLRFQEFRERAVAVANWFHLQTGLIVYRWVRLLDSLSEDKILDMPPYMPFYGSRAKLWYRRIIQPKIRYTKQMIRGITYFIPRYFKS